MPENGPEAPAAPSSGLSPRLGEWQGWAQGEGGQVALAPHLLAATPQRPRGSLPGPPTLSGHHCCWPEPYVGSRHHRPPPRMLLGEGTALTPWVSPDRGPSQAPETRRHSHGATQPPSPPLRTTYPAGPLPQSTPRSPGRQRHARRERGRPQRPRAPRAPQAHVRLRGGKHLSGLAELLEDELSSAAPPSHRPAALAEAVEGGHPGPSCHSDIWDSHRRRKQPPQPPPWPGAGRARPEERLPVGRPGPLPHSALHLQPSSISQNTKYKKVADRMWLPTARAPGRGRQAGSRAAPAPPPHARPLLRPGNQFILFCLCSLNAQRPDRAGSQGSCSRCQESASVGVEAEQGRGLEPPQAPGQPPAGGRKSSGGLLSPRGPHRRRRCLQPRPLPTEAHLWGHRVAQGPQPCQ